MRIIEFMNGNINVRRDNRVDYAETILEFLQKVEKQLRNLGYEVKITSDTQLCIEGKTFTFTWNDICKYNYYESVKLRNVL